MGNRGRTPSVSESALVAAIDALTTVEQPVADTGEIFAHLDLDVSERTVRDTLRKFHAIEGSSIHGTTPGEQSGWVWWVVPDAVSHGADASTE